MEYNEPIKKEDKKKNWFSYISEKSEEVYKIFKVLTILSSICYIIYKYTCLKDAEKFYGIPYFYFLNMDIIQDIIYYMLIFATLIYSIISIIISISIEKNEESLENKEILFIINSPNIVTAILVTFELFTYKINKLHFLFILYVVVSIILFSVYFVPLAIEEILYFLKTMKQFFIKNKEKFKLISNEIVKKIKSFFQYKTIIKCICQLFLIISNSIIICIFSSSFEKNKYEEKKDYEIIVKDDIVDTNASIKNIQVIVGYYNNCAIVMTANEDKDKDKNKVNLVIAKNTYKLIPIDNLKIRKKQFDNVECK